MRLRSCEKIVCDTGQAPKPKRCPTAARPFPQRVPNKSLMEINTAPEGADPFAFRLDSRFQDYLGSRRVMRKYAESRVCRTLRPGQGIASPVGIGTNALVYGTNSANCVLQAVATKPLILLKNAVTKLRLFRSAL
jgi:hypothetical protein